MYQNVHHRAPLYCDAGPQTGKTRIDVTAYLYLDDDELAQFHKYGFSITLNEASADDQKPAKDDDSGHARFL